MLQMTQMGPRDSANHGTGGSDPFRLRFCEPVSQAGQTCCHRFAFGLRLPDGLPASAGPERPFTGSLPAITVARLSFALRTPTPRGTRRPPSRSSSGTPLARTRLGRGSPIGGCRRSEPRDRGPYFRADGANSIVGGFRNLDRGLAYDRDGAVYFRMTREPITIPDRIVGDVLRPLTDREEQDPDWVLWRSDGQPVFHFVNIVDDLEMGITHVIRGDDHLTNTAKHIALFRAFGVPTPEYGHLPLILNEDGSKMSKRDRGAVVTGMRTRDSCPKPWLTTCPRSDGHPPTDRSCCEPRKSSPASDSTASTRSPARFDVKKADRAALNTRRMDPDAYVAQGVQYLRRAGIETSDFDPSYVRAALLTSQERASCSPSFPSGRTSSSSRMTRSVLDPEARAKTLVPTARP